MCAISVIPEAGSSMVSFANVEAGPDFEGSKGCHSVEASDFERQCRENSTEFRGMLLTNVRVNPHPAGPLNFTPPDGGGGFENPL